jgi:hypothetical protein
MWTKNDLLSYGLLFECVHQGYIACPKWGFKPHLNIQVA